MEDKNKTNTLIISDFHLGTKVSQSDKILETLKKVEFEKLILLGDIFEDLNFKRLRTRDWELLSFISKLSKTKKVVWVEGNHDKGLTDFFSTLTDIKVYKYYKWKYNNKKYFAIHGHQYDNFLIDNYFISWIANKIYNMIQVLDFRDRRISKYIKRKSKGWLRLSDKVARKAILQAKLLQIDYVFCGHTHKAMTKKDGKVSYYNCGAWTDFNPTYITLDKDDIEIRDYQ